MDNKSLKNFYIAEEQSIYLLSQNDAKKLKDWIELCVKQLEKLGYSDISLLGKGAYGFAFSGLTPNGKELVFKFSRITLPNHIQERLEEEAYMLSKAKHALIPQFIEYAKNKKQSILLMGRGQGTDLEQWSLKNGKMPTEILISIAYQLVLILNHLRNFSEKGTNKPIVHGDIKPSNITYCESTGKISLIDWGSSVFAQVDETGNFVSQNIMDLMSTDIHNTNARLGDVYFIGPEQISGEVSSPRFDEQGAAATLYALASAQSCRFGAGAIPARSLGLPKEFATVIDAMLCDDRKKREEAGDYLLRNMKFMRNIVLSKTNKLEHRPAIPVWFSPHYQDIDTVVYSSRKSFLREEDSNDGLMSVNDAQLDKYYKNYLQGMGETEKAFIAAVSRLGRYPVVGGIVVRWEKDGVYIDSSLGCFDSEHQDAFTDAVNNVVTLALSIHRVGIFKSCMFNAKETIHVERKTKDDPFDVSSLVEQIGYDVSAVSSKLDVEEKMHSYFEDGKDPDEKLYLPFEIMQQLSILNSIHHTGCIIFEVLPTHLKIHNYYKLLDTTREEEFKQCLNTILDKVPLIKGEGVSGFMKLPYKDTRYFEHQSVQTEKYYPVNPLLSEQK